MNLEEIKEKLIKNNSLSESMEIAVNRLCKEKRRPLGKFNPWAWWVEIVRGCNLSCYHCPTRLFPKGYREFMSEETWVALLELIQEVTPHTRLEFGNAGEPTLHPQFLKFLKIAREICPHLQILTYTNGTQIVSKKLTYKDMFDAGLNMVFLDMYAPLSVHSKIAEESGYYWYYQDNKPKDAINVFRYQNDPDAHVIMLAENPHNWSNRKKGRGYLQTFFNDLDWKEAKKYGMKPVTEPPTRRCDLPNKFINVNFDGTYIFCCFDYMRHTVDKFGNVKNGLEDFINFWLGEYMQKTRKLLHYKNRINHPYCSKCCFTSIRCDIPYWPEDMYEQYWNGKTWRRLMVDIDKDINKNEYQKQMTEFFK
jgi:organic radical activating enzyme